MFLSLYEGQSVKIQNILIEQTNTVTTYNIEVEDYHTYYVGKTGVLVHNAGCGKYKVYKPDEIAKKYNVTTNDFHRKVKPTITNKAKPNFKVNSNPDIMLDRAHNIAYQGANGKGFQETGLNMLEILKELGLGG